MKKVVHIIGFSNLVLLKSLSSNQDMHNFFYYFYKTLRYASTFMKTLSLNMHYCSRIIGRIKYPLN